MNEKKVIGDINQLVNLQEINVFPRKLAKIPKRDSTNVRDTNDDVDMSKVADEMGKVAGGGKADTPDKRVTVTKKVIASIRKQIKAGKSDDEILKAL